MEVVTQFLGDLDHEFDIEVTTGIGLCLGDAFAFEPEDLAALAAWRNFEFDVPMWSGSGYGCAANSFTNSDGDVEIEIESFTCQSWMRLNADFKVEVTSGTATTRRRAFARQANTGPFIDTGGYLHCESLWRSSATTAITGRASSRTQSA